MKEFLHGVTHWVQNQGAWAPVGFVLAYAGLTVGFVPGSLLTLAAGAIFGLWLGTVLVSVASMLAAAINFLLARGLLRGWVETKISAMPKFRAIDAAVGREGWKIVVLLRLSPVLPFALLNYALGLTPIRFWQAILASWLGMLPATVLYVFLGSLARTATSETTAAQKIFSVIGLLATVAATIWITRLAKRAVAEKVES